MYARTCCSFLKTVPWVLNILQCAHVQNLFKNPFCCQMSDCPLKSSGMLYMWNCVCIFTCKRIEPSKNCFKQLWVLEKMFEDRKKTINYSRECNFWWTHGSPIVCSPRWAYSVCPPGYDVVYKMENKMYVCTLRHTNKLLRYSQGVKHIWLFL